METLDKEMISFLQQYLRIDTTHPQPDYKKVFDHFKKQAIKDGFDYKEVALPSGNAVLIVTLQGRDKTLPSLALNHHMDVVPANNIHEWKSPPFAGEVHDGCIIGRGTQDMKGVGVAHYFALKKLKESGIMPDRTIHLFIVPDEERGGFKGTKEFIESNEFKSLDVGFVLDEGRASGDKKIVYLAVDERKPIQIKIKSEGSLAHGSRLTCLNAIHELVLFLHTIVLLHKKQQQKASYTEVGLLLSMNITSVTSGIFNNDVVALNVVPNNACATIDIRVPPTMSLKQACDIFEQELENFTTVTYSIEATIPDRLQYNTAYGELYKTVEKVVHQRNFIAKSSISEGTTDIRYYRAYNIEGVGLTPFTSKDNIHGTNESITITELIQGKNIFYDFLIDFCSKKGTKPC
jgi:aminoacylase